MNPIDISIYIINIKILSLSYRSLGSKNIFTQPVSTFANRKYVRPFLFTASTSVGSTFVCQVSVDPSIGTVDA